MLSIESREKEKKKKKEALDSDFQQKSPSRQHKIESHEGQEKERASHLQLHSWEHSC